MLQLIDRLPEPWSSAVTAALLGDAFGVPHEFKPGYDIPVEARLGMVMPQDYRKTYEHVPYGTWSDDGSQMMALLDALLTTSGRYEPDIFKKNLLAWFRQARYQVGGVVFDCGAQTRAALEYLEQGKPAPGQGGHCGNGSLMRVLPVAALPDTFGVRPVDAIHIAMAQSAMTHPQALARVCCALYIELCWLLRAGVTGLWSLVPVAAQNLKDRAVLKCDELEALANILEYGQHNLPANSGYVVNSLWSAVWAVDQSRSLSGVLRRAVSLGGDTDTVACIAAGLASLVYGWDSTAHLWRRQMSFYA